jgi:glycosyltransferase involved in cell wall biosynthesis
MKESSTRPRLVIAVNSAIALGFVQGQPEHFQNRGFDVTLLCPERRENEWQVAPPVGIPIIEVPMDREIAPAHDFVTLLRLWRTMRLLQPSVTNVGTPKAGLLGGVAAWLNRVRCRFYTLHGLRFETTKGLKRRMLILAERLACLLAHRVVCVSHSVREKAIAAGLAPRDKLIVLGAGSCNGIDADRFAPHPRLIQRATALRRQLGIPERASVLLFLGRLTGDKGIPELVAAFGLLKKQFPDLRLLLAGCLEAEDPLPVETRREMAANPHILFAGAVQDTPCYYAAADIVVLPSHREGLPTVLLEAQAAGKPVVGANATGIVDMVAHGVTGLLFPVGDVAALAHAIETLLTDKALARQLETTGQERVRREFRQERIWDALHREYLAVLRKERPLPTASRRCEDRTLVTSSND